MHYVHPIEIIPPKCSWSIPDFFPVSDCDKHNTLS